MQIPEHGYVDNGNDTDNRKATGSVVVFKCRHGYVLEGNEESACLLNGTWTAFPSCTRTFDLLDLKKTSYKKKKTSVRHAQNINIERFRSGGVRRASDPRQRDPEKRRRRNAKFHFRQYGLLSVRPGVSRVRTSEPKMLGERKLVQDKRQMFECVRRNEKKNANQFEIYSNGTQNDEFYIDK